MALHHPRVHTTEGQDVPTYRSTASTTTHTTDDEVLPDVDEPPDQRRYTHPIVPEFHKSAIRPQSDRKESLLTRAFQASPTAETAKPDIRISTDISRRRSSNSNTSASTVELTSDGGITSPARTETPSPSLPTYINFAPFTFNPKPTQSPATIMIHQDPMEPVVTQLPASTTAKPDPVVEALVRKRCISFACVGQRPRSPTSGAPKTTSSVPTESEVRAEKVPPKKTTIKFACAGPAPSERSQSTKNVTPIKTPTTSPPERYLENTIRQNNQSLPLTRKYKSTPQTPTKPQRDLTTANRRVTRSPVATRSRRPTYIVADEESLRPSEATRFHEFASDEIEEDDWIRKDTSESKQKLTINDTLKKENVIRQLGKEAEEEALEDEVDDDEEGAEDSNDENEDDDEDNDVDEDEEETVDGSDLDSSDGNETDNEEGFADSDDESDATGDFQLWTPGRAITRAQPVGSGAIRTNRRRTASESSIDSLKLMDTSSRAQVNGRPIMRRRKTSRKVKILPGTPDLPDSTDFVCGTLDEDRPIEDAYVSCMEARKREKHRTIPQDIDPSFPTSDLEDEDEDEVTGAANDSDEPLWLHGKFEDDDDDHTRRRSRKSPNHSPKRLHSPPPPKRYHSPLPGRHRLRSPPPRRLFGHSPKRVHSPPAHTVHSPTASPMNRTTIFPLPFAPLGQRPGLTHTKSLPRTPNAFAQYCASRLPALDDAEGSETANGYTRGAIDIVKGLERKRQRRKEKHYQKQHNRARRGQPERKPLPGKGAERMRELGLLMAGKLGRAENDEYMWSA